MPAPLTPETLYEFFRQCTGVSTDTRRISPGTLFIALKGDTFDGNQFAGAALETGARYAVVSDPAVATDERFLLVNDTLLALQDLARQHRRQLRIPIIGVGGSNGKTTTKELLAGVLSTQFTTFATRGNLNNHIGLPLSVLSIDDTYQMAVLELGANRQREIALLASICQPSHGLITNIGKSHLEGFGGLEGVRKGEGELYDYLAETGGTVFVNAQDRTLVEMHGERSGFGETVFFLEDNVPELLSEAPVVIFRAENGEEVQTYLPGRYNFENMAAALKIGQYFGVAPAPANHAVAEYNPTNNRSQTVQRGTNTVLLDAYNANPSSMGAAVAQFAQMPAQRRMVILGDMFELGDYSPAEHRAMGELVAKYNFDVVLLAGKDMKYALEALPKAYYFPDKFSLHNWLIDHPQQHTHVLIKGSRGVALETVLPYLGD